MIRTRPRNVAGRQAKATFYHRLDRQIPQANRQSREQITSGRPRVRRLESAFGASAKMKQCSSGSAISAIALANGFAGATTLWVILFIALYHLIS
jgi:hypothetical protein